MKDEERDPLGLYGDVADQPSPAAKPDLETLRIKVDSPLVVGFHRDTESPATPSSRSNGKKVKAEDDEDEAKPTLIWDLREALEEALCTFVTLEESTYQNKSLGASRQLEESMTCECIWDAANPEDACGENCINRLTQVECVAGSCRCRSHCLNQRFQRRQYAPIDVVLTEKKGYGVRAHQPLEADTFIYEYIGEVIPHNTFARRIKEYADVGIEHFYFMQLQKDEYIDATRKGGLGRFLNHSCRPNCYVAKWIVGKKLRMGIFTKRDIVAGEELTFNYNVDRYGHDAQECFCGESNCVGWIGGKTQTDIGAMDDLYLDALGITDDVEAQGMKGSKKRKSRKLDIDFIPVLTPIQLGDAPKVAAAIRQATSIPRILSKLLERVQLTTDGVVQRQLMRLHGISLMASVLNEHEGNAAIIAPVIEILLGWPLITRNKLVSSNIEPLIERLTANEDEGVAARAGELVKFWATLELGYRIPKAVQDALSDASHKRGASETFESLFSKRPRIEDEELAVVDATAESTPKFVAAAATIIAEEVKRDLPAGWRMARSVGGVPYYYQEVTSQTSWVFPDAQIVAALAAEHAAKQRARAEQVDVTDILGRARQQQEEAEAARLAEEAAQAQLKADRRAAAKAKAERREERKRKEKARAEAKAAAAAKKAAARDLGKDKEKVLLRAFGAIVVNTMSKWKHQFETDQFKRRAKEITQLLCDKEKKSSSYEKETYASLSKDKTAKIRKFVEDYVQKLLARKNGSKSNSPTKSSASAPPSATLPPADQTKIDDDERAMVRELAGDDGDDAAADEAVVSEHEPVSSDDEEVDTPDRDTPMSTPSAGKPFVPPPPPPPIISATLCEAKEATVAVDLPAPPAVETR